MEAPTTYWCVCVCMRMCVCACVCVHAYTTYTLDILFKNIKTRWADYQKQRNQTNKLTSVSPWANSGLFLLSTTIVAISLPSSVFTLWRTALCWKQKILLITVRKISWIKKNLIWKEQYDFGHQLHHSTTKINVHILISTGRFQINLHIHDSPLPTIDLCQTWHYLMRYCLKHIPPIYAFRDVQCIFLFYQHFKAKHQSFFYNTPATQKSCCGLFKGISFGACHVIFGRWHYTCISQS